MRQANILFALLLVSVAAQADCTFTLRLTNAQGDDWAGAMVRVAVGYGTANPQVHDFTVSSGGMEEHVFTGYIGNLVSLNYLPGGGSAAGHSAELIAVNGWTMAGPWNLSAPGGIFWAFTVNGICNIPQAPPADCLGAVFLAGQSDFLFPVAPGSVGNISDLDASNSGCLATEHSGFWVQLHIMFGQLDFLLAVQNGNQNAEIDFALWGPVSGPYCTSLGQPIRCSVAATGSPTGLDSTAFDSFEGTDGDGWLTPLPEVSCSTYLLYVAVESATPVTVGLHVSNVLGFDCWPLEIPEQGVRRIVVSPQPASDELRIAGLIPGESAFIHGIDGRVITVIDASDAVLDVRQWPSGCYIVRIGQSSTRFVVEH